MPKKKVKDLTEGDGGLTLDIIEELGGTKADLDLLNDLEDDVEIADHKEDFETEPINKDDIRSFMEDIGLADLRRERKIKEAEEKEKELAEKPRKIKLAVIPGMEDEEDEEKESKPSVEEPKEKKKKGKKKKEKSEVLIQDTQVSSTTQTQSKMKAGSLAFLQDLKPRKHPLIKSEGKWYENEFPSDPQDFESTKAADLKKIEEYAAKLLEQDVALYKKQEETKRKSDTMWIRTVLKSGTVGDRMAALTILIQDSPVHNMASLDLFINMMKKKGRREALSAIDTLKDLFLSDLLPDRKLKTFEQHPLSQVDTLASGNKDMRDRRLLIWYYEHQLRDRYASFVKSLETLAHDSISGPKKKALGVIQELLTQKPEQEKVLLSLLVNKLGDPDYKVAAKGAHLLTTLVGSHPNMKFVIVMEVERVLYRPNIAAKAQYYAVCFLNQLILSNEEQKLAARLISIYFSFFKAYVKRGEVDGKMLSALLTGVNRAFPYAKSESQSVTDQMDTLFKIVHIVSFNTSIQALMLLYQVMDHSDKASERFYMALYKKLLDPGLKSSSKQTMFLNLLFRSMKKDTSQKRVQAFVKRLLQICCQESAPFICASLILVTELIKSKPNLLRLAQVGEESDDEEEHFVDAPDEDELTEKVKDAEAESDVQKKVPTHSTASWVHRTNTTDAERSSEYDPLGRNPLFSRAELECVYELRKLANHYHPSVSLWARNILKGDKIRYDSDPLTDFTLIRFLDRFVYRNPKKKEGGVDSVLSARRKKSGGRDLAPVNSDRYIELGEENIPADEKFFYRYFSQQAAKAKSKKAEDEDSNASDVSDEEFDGYLENFEKGLLEEGKKEMDFASEFKKQKSKKKKKKVEGESESEEEEDIDDLSDEEIDLGDMDEEFAELMNDDDDGDEDMDDDDDGDDDPGFDEEDIEFSDDDAEFDAGSKGKKPVKGKRSLDDGEDMFGAPAKRKKGAMSAGGSGGLFASADDFAHMLEENMGSKLDMTGSNAFANKDNADAKQIQWEAKRDNWMRDGGRGRRKPGFKKGNFKGQKKGKGKKFK